MPSNLTGWFSVGGTGLSLQNLTKPVSSALPTSMRVSTNGSSNGQIGFGNTGYWGIEVKKQDYQGSFYVKGSINGSFTASLQSALTNETFGSVQIPSRSSNDWTQYNYTLCPERDAPNSNNTLIITFDASCATDGYLDFNLISLFPPTYKNTPNGNRPELMEALAGLKPTFLRLPGGNNLEGNDPPYFWKWNQTIGPLVDRPGYPGTWNYENTDGLGLIEYMHWCRDLGMEPILAVWDGFYLEGPAINQSHLQPYIDFALNELEFLMGDKNTTYGAQRAALGYDAFEINWVEVGNEDNLGGGAASYSAYRFRLFNDAILAKYPHMNIIASTVVIDPFPGNASGDYHQYSRPDHFVGQFNFFDNFTSEHKTLIGEYATVQPNNGTDGAGVDFDIPRSLFPFWIGTVAEAVFLLGAERNADKIIGAAYAPLLQNLNSYQWAPDLISFTADTSQTILSTSYHMLALMGGTHITETREAPGTFGPAYWVTGKTESGYAMKAAVYNATEDVPMTITFPEVGAGTKATLTVLTADSPDAYNGLGTPNVVQTTTTEVTSSGAGSFSFSLPNLSIAVLETGCQGASNGTYGAPQGYGRKWSA